MSGRGRRRSGSRRVAAGRRRWVAPGRLLRAAPRAAREEPDAAPFRIGYTASRKIGNAVARNRARRRLRAAVAEIMPARASPGCDYVLIARARTVDRRFADLVTDLETAFDGLAAKGNSR